MKNSMPDAVSLNRDNSLLSSNLIVQTSKEEESIEISYQEAIREALREKMLEDPMVCLIGEDIGKHGGAFGVTRTLFDQFGPERVIDTPISENSIVGVGTGAALCGLKPVIEIMFVDFSMLAMDQIANQAAKMRFMTGGQCQVPWVLRMPQGGGAGKSIAAQHSQSLEAWFSHIPGLKVVFPSTPYDAKGLMKSAIDDLNPVIFLEHKFLYSLRGLVPKANYQIPIGKCDIKRIGKDITVIADGSMVWHAMQATQIVQKDKIDVEVIDVQTIAPLDEQSIGQSVRKTGRAIVVSEACRSYGPANEWGMVAIEQAFDYLKAPIRRITGRHTPIPFANSLEEGVWPDTNDIVEAIYELTSY